ncbi:MAG TPA: adenylate kinase [Planctomycetes bacterium]|nr:adenylate kinase [Planctomycetota bacterium]
MASLLILLGAPGAGKGTQAVRLSAALGMPHISTGDLFRANLRDATPIGMKAKEYMDAGKLVPDEIVLDMLFERVAAPDCAEGYLLDGFPRTLPQAQALEGRLGPQDKVTVLELRVPDEAIVGRAAGRLVCRKCGATQHREFSPPKTEGVCDACGGELYQRRDDTPEVVRERLRVYHEQTAPLVDFYSAKGLLASVDGSKSPDEVFQELEAALAERG